MYAAPPPRPKNTPYPIASWINPPAVAARAIPSAFEAAQASTSDGAEPIR